MGAANSVPAWRTPRRLATTRSAIRATPIGTACDLSDGTAEVTAATPDVTDTATVRT